VDTILTEHELLLPREWFTEKKVLDAGCGNGRWSYGFSKLNVNLTCVDINQSAIDYTRAAINDFSNPQKFIVSPLENLREHFSEASFDLVFCWGVAHHCRSFTKVIRNLAEVCRSGGILYLYLYGRESMSLEEDIALFKDRVQYNVLLNDDQKMAFLLAKAKGNKNRLHNEHDIYAPLVNRRFTYEEICEMLSGYGFGNFVRTIEHSEIFIRAEKQPGDIGLALLPKQSPPFWFQKKF
jgi:SAM-dependent methyltransferase